MSTFARGFAGARRTQPVAEAASASAAGDAGVRAIAEVRRQSAAAPASANIAEPRPRTTTRTRALAVPAAAASALAVWVIAVPVLGVHLLVRFGSGSPQQIQPWLVGGAAVWTSLAGWLLLAVLERRVRNALNRWTAVAVLVTLVSLSLPAIAGVTVASGVALALMHVAIAAVVIPAMRRGAQGSMRSVKP